MIAGGDETTHVTAEIVAGYLDRTLDATDRRGIEEHLAACDECRSEFIEVSRLLQSRKARRRLYVLWPAAAAAAALFLIVGRPTPERPAAETALRGPASRDAGVPRFDVVTPVGDGAAVPTPIAFVWRSVAPDVSYRLTVTDALGDVVWTTTTADTSALLPAGVVMDSLATYYWYVDALLLDGRSATSGVRRIIVRP